MPMIAFVDRVLDETFRPEMAVQKGPHSEAELKKIRRGVERVQQKSQSHFQLLRTGIRVLDTVLALLPRPLAVRVRAALRGAYHRMAGLRRRA